MSGREGDFDPGVELLVPTPASEHEALARAERFRELVASLIERNRQLQTALDSRVVIEQAKGILAGRFGLDTDEAFEHLRRAARSNRLPIHEVAAGVVAQQRLLRDGAKEPREPEPGVADYVALRSSPSLKR